MRVVVDTAYLLVPLLGGGAFHALCMKYDWFSVLKRPIDYGYTIRGQPLFGANKTFRGPLAVGLGAAIVLGVQATVLHRLSGVRDIELFDYGSVNGWLLGFLVGMAAMVAELPNSFLKRRIGVGPGQASQGLLGAVLYVLDQVDILLGAWLVFALVLDIRVIWVLLSVVLVVVVHQLLTSATYALGMRESPW
jgi:CDP-diglyceride synthetase